MDLLDRVLPKPIRTEEFRFYSASSPDDLVERMNKVFESTRGFVLSPNLAGEFISAYGFRAQPKWSLLVVNKASTGPAVRMDGEVCPEGSGSLVTIELNAHWTLGLFVLFPPALALIWLIIVPKDHLSFNLSKESLVPIGLLLLFPTFALLSAWIAKRLFKRTFVNTFKLTQVEEE